MKTAHRKPRSKAYVCRKCNRQDFKTMMKFTQHLRNCRVVDVPFTQMPVPVPRADENGLKEELRRLRTLGIEVRDLADRLLKKVK